MRRILVIRGGAIGDFVLTLPTIGALRRAFPQARLELLGHKHIVALAENRVYADATRSIEDSTLAGFFAENSELSPEWRAYFATFDLIISYLSDPQRIFEANLRRCGEAEVLSFPAMLSGATHAALQLAEPLARLSISIMQSEPCLYPSNADRAFAESFIETTGKSRMVALHPGSGSERKNWPLDRWSELAMHLRARSPLLVVGGEADQAQLAALRARIPGEQVRFAADLPLPQLAAVLEKCAGFVGHDSGISHIAAAVGIPCLLLFGPTDPQVWAPANENARVLRAPASDLKRLSVETVAQELMRIGIST